jgi:hypothetical protein
LLFSGEYKILSATRESGKFGIVVKIGHKLPLPSIGITQWAFQANGQILTERRAFQKSGNEIFD